VCALGHSAVVSVHTAACEAQSCRHTEAANVVIITVDTLRADQLRCYGYSNIETPTMDALAQQGVLFENAFAQAPLTPLRIPMMSISQSDVTPIRSERSDARLSQCESVIGIRQKFCSV